MRKIKSCQFNIDSTMIDVIFANGSKVSYYTVGIKESLNLTPITRDKLSWLLESNLESGIRKSLVQKFSPEIARQIAREMMMCG